MVWKSTKRIGCAVNPSCDDGTVVFSKLVCRYDPPGNQAGQYVTNVFKP
jgi:hypothetical protein